MKRFLVCLFVIIGLTGSAFAQLAEKLTLQISGGSVLPVESFLMNPIRLVQVPDGTFGPGTADNPTAFEEYYQTGYALNVGIGYKINRHFSAVANIGYNTFGFDQAVLENQIGNGLAAVFQTLQPPLTYQPVGLSIDGGRANILTGAITGKAGIQTGFLAPYIMAGGGFIRVNQDLINISYITDEANYYDRIVATETTALFATGGGGLALALFEQMQPFLEGGYHLGLTDSDNTLYYSVQFGFLFNLTGD